MWKNETLKRIDLTGAVIIAAFIVYTMVRDEITSRRQLKALMSEDNA